MKPSVTSGFPGVYIPSVLLKNLSRDFPALLDDGTLGGGKLQHDKKRDRHHILNKLLFEAKTIR
jgi:hypothetical protein